MSLMFWLLKSEGRVKVKCCKCKKIRWVRASNCLTKEQYEKRGSKVRVEFVIHKGRWYCPHCELP